MKLAITVAVEDEKSSKEIEKYLIELFSQYLPAYWVVHDFYHTTGIFLADIIICFGKSYKEDYLLKLSQLTFQPKVINITACDKIFSKNGIFYAPYNLLGDRDKYYVNLVKKIATIDNIIEPAGSWEKII